MVTDSAKQQSSSRPRWVQLKTGSPIIQKTLELCVSSLLRGHTAQKKKRKNSLYRPHGKTRTRQSFVPPCAKAMPISVSFKSGCTSRFVHCRRASILVFESIRNRQAECHLESRVIPADDSRKLPLFEKFLQSLPLQGGLRLNLAHRHPITPISHSQLDQDIKDIVQFWRVLCVRLAVLSVRRLLPKFNGGHRASIWGAHVCVHSLQRPINTLWWCVFIAPSFVRCIGSGGRKLGHWSWCCARASRSHVFDHSVRRCIRRARPPLPLAPDPPSTPSPPPTLHTPSPRSPRPRWVPWAPPPSSRVVAVPWAPSHSSSHDRPACGRYCVDRAQALMILTLLGRSAWCNIFWEETA